MTEPGLRDRDSRRVDPPDGVAFTGERKQVRKATGCEQQRVKAALSASVRGLREPNFRPPLERIGDPQISPTRQRSKLGMDGELLN